MMAPMPIGIDETDAIETQKDHSNCRVQIEKVEMGDKRTHARLFWVDKVISSSGLISQTFVEPNCNVLHKKTHPL